MQTLENIKRELRQKAEGKFSELGREQELLVNWMAQELYGLRRELRQSQDYVAQNVARRIRPELSTRPMPVHALAHAAAPKDGQVLKPGDAVFTIQRFGNQQPREIYFTPLQPVQLVGARVRWRCFGQIMEEVVDGQFTDEKARTTSDRSFHPGVLWLGIEPVKGAALPSCLTFHIEVGLENDRMPFEQMLPLIQWHCNGQALPSEMGMGHIFKPAESNGQRPLDAEYLHLHSIEKQVVGVYDGQFVAVENRAGFFPSEIPQAVQECFAEEALEKVKKQECIWLKLVLPHGFGPASLAATNIRLNCFPILNRKLDKTRDFTPSNFGSVEILPLSNADNRRGDLGHTGDQFLGIERIFSNKMDYRATTYEPFREVPTGYYALQHGRVEANDFRDVLHRAGELAELVQTHAPRLQQVSGHSVQSALGQLQSSCTDLQHALEQIPPAATDPGHYLHLKAADPQDMIYVRFWLTQGQAAEGVLSNGDLLEGGDGVWAITSK